MKAYQAKLLESRRHIAQCEIQVRIPLENPQPIYSISNFTDPLNAQKFRN